jgi:hypothetical protein
MACATRLNGVCSRAQRGNGMTTTPALGHGGFAVGALGSRGVHHTIASTSGDDAGSKEGSKEVVEPKRVFKFKFPEAEPQSPVPRSRHDPTFSLEDKAERLKSKGIVLTGAVPTGGLLALNTLRPTVPRKLKKRVSNRPPLKYWVNAQTECPMELRALSLIY